jgi:exopolysaccharide biosynthesis polyprenyl glycosylphosphotransferase
MYLPVLVLIIIVFLCSFFISGLYQPIRSISYIKEAINILKASILGVFLTFALAFCLKLGFASRSLLFIFWFLTILYLPIIRIILRHFLTSLYLKGYNSQQVLIVGKGELAEKVSLTLNKHPELGFQIIGFIDEEGNSDKASKVQTMGKINDIPDILHEIIVDEVVFAVPIEDCERMTEAIKLCEVEGIKVRIVADLFERTIARTKIDDIDGIPIITLETGPAQEIAIAIKRILDVIISLLSLIMLTPLFGIIAILIKFDSPGPVFFKQERMGQNGRRFVLLKFRSMIEEAEQVKEQLQGLNEASGPVFKMRADPRITKTGYFLRKTSLDELPQFINVLKGEMSLVGPRPPLPDEVAQYKNWQRRRLSMKPGITCIWQVSGRSNVSFEKWMKMDMEYIDNWSLGLDIKLLLKTIWVVLHGKGAY